MEFLAQNIFPILTANRLQKLWLAIKYHYGTKFSNKEFAISYPFEFSLQLSVATHDQKYK